MTKIADVHVVLCNERFADIVCLLARQCNAFEGTGEIVKDFADDELLQFRREAKKGRIICMSSDGHCCCLSSDSQSIVALRSWEGGLKLSGVKFGRVLQGEHMSSEGCASGEGSADTGADAEVARHSPGRADDGSHCESSSATDVVQCGCERGCGYASREGRKERGYVPAVSTRIMVKGCCANVTAFAGSNLALQERPMRSNSSKPSMRERS